MKVVSLFSGCGGMDLGFIESGMDVVWANDIYADAVQTYQHNIGSHIILKDIADIPSSEIPECDGLIGGFPCQGFSVANMNRNVNDSRNRLYREFVRVISDKKPVFFVAENVKGILSLGKGLVFQQIIKDFSDTGYSVKHHLFNAADYGVPQKRQRVIIFGVRQDVPVDWSYFPPPATHAQQPKANQSKWISISTALKGLPEPGLEDPLEIPNHTGTKYKLRNNGYLGHRFIDPDAPSPTITARGDERGGVVIIHHPSNNRRLTVREAALIQSFPTGFRFIGSNTSGYRQIGNAVPPGLAAVVAQSVKKCLLNRHP